MENWTKKNALWMVLYAVLYALTTAIVCVTGAIHPIQIEGYQITAGILITGIVIFAFDRVKAPGAAICLGAGMLLLLVIIGDAVAWHVIPVILIALLAEAVRALFHYHWTGNLIAAVIMTFSSFGYYGQIWFNRAYTYQCALEEMPAGYGDTLMASSPVWSFPLVIIAGIAMAMIIANVTAHLFHLEKS